MELVISDPHFEVTRAPDPVPLKPMPPLSKLPKRAGFIQRVAAVLVDVLILVAGMLLLVFAWVMAGGQLTPLYHALFLAYWVLVPALYHAVLWSRTGATLGKRLLGIKVVDAETREPVRFRRALLRYVLYYPSTAVLCLGHLWALVDENHQTWHDLLTQTDVRRG